MNTAQISLSDGELQDSARLLSTDPKAAAARLREYLKVNPLSAQAYRLLARALEGDQERPTDGDDSVIVTVSSGALARAARALQDEDLETAEIILRRRLRDRPDDDEALQLLAELASRLDFQDEAEALLSLAIELAPKSIGSRIQLAALAYRRNRPEDAIQLLDEVVSRDATNLTALNLKAAALARAGRADESIRLYEESLQLQPAQPHVWSWYGQALRTLGRGDESIAAIRKGIDLSPGSGELWWSLSDLKTYRLDEADAERMQAALTQSAPRSKDRIYLHFALGKASEDFGDHEGAFAHYAEGNRLQKVARDYDPDEISEYVDAAQHALTSGFFGDRAPWGFTAHDPIFVVGMPRSGSTLLEQILGCHPEIEATMELPELVELAELLAKNPRQFVSKLASASAPDVEALGRTYVERTRRYRKTSRPLFVDKMPNNWLYVPLIQLALPNAKIIDIRRHPLDCCLSNFKQMFLARQGFSNDLTWLGRYYRDYVEMMRHIDEVLPGRVHRVIYERLVENSEQEVRSALEYVGVPFDDACLRPHEGQGLVRTTSAEQVRRPINREGIGSWRAFEPWLDPLKQALGPVLTDYAA